MFPDTCSLFLTNLIALGIPNPDSRLPTPDSRFPVPYYLLQYLT
ncbi:MULTISPECIES: hypothetical protein [Moorena]|nr:MULTISPECIES: hypothetical protein [Moorena]